MNTQKLKPCPFCGGDAFLFIPTDSRMHKSGCFVECKNCGCRTSGDYPNADSMEIAIETWNTRADGWISVEDESFSANQTAIVFIPLKNGYYMNMVTSNDEGDLYDADGGYIGYHASQISYWMPLPTCPATHK